MIIVDAVKPSALLARHNLPAELEPDIAEIVEAVLRKESDKIINQKIVGLANKYTEIDPGLLSQVLAELVEARTNVPDTITGHLAMDNL